jgi:signal transduction histidine kinase
VNLLGFHLPKFLTQRWLRWLAVGLAVLLIFLYETLEVNWASNVTRATWIILDVLVLSFVTAIAYIAFDRWQRASAERSAALEELSKVEEKLNEIYQRQAAVLHISQMFAEASDEAEVIDQVLRYSIDLLQAQGASFVPLDEHAQPQVATSLGEMPFPVADAWMEYLASPEVRQQCDTCKNHRQFTRSCPLVKDPFSDAQGVYCLPVQRGDQEYGVLTLYIPLPEQLDQDTQVFVQTLVDETSLALEGVRLRKRAITTLRQLQTAREKADLNRLLTELLQNLHETLDTDYALVRVWDPEAGKPLNTIFSGELPEKAQLLIDGILHSVITSKEPVILGSVAGDAVSSPGVRALMAVPLVAQDQPAFGAILVANRRPKAFNQNQLTTLQTIAGQVALVVQNTNLLAQLEYDTMMRERTRLAREIHDGLAQTLGFLKLNMAQMKNYIESGEVELLRKTANTCYDVLADAYQDARSAIDGLRITPSEDGLEGWLRQTVQEFEELSGIQANLCEPLAVVELLPEVHAQLIRIVQEALSNIRKHADARSVQISCEEFGNDLILEVSDDGRGFSPEEVPTPYQHGLRGMRERAELIGADFQVVGLPNKGTTVRLRLPLEVKEKAG